METKFIILGGRRMGRLAYIPGLGDGILLVAYDNDYDDDRFEAAFTSETVIDLAMNKENRVNRILHVTREGLVAELTIAFENGRLDLVRKALPNQQKIDEPGGDN